MYNNYFGFREKPFNLTPDPRFFYTNPIYQEAYATLLCGIRERKGFLVLTGEVGTGKTTLLRKLMDNLDGTVRYVFFYNTNLTFEELLTFTCKKLALAVEGTGRLPKIQALNDFLIEQLERGGTAALLIDEAQNLSEEVLESLRLLSNLETGSEKLLQIVLVGQPELESLLDRPKLRQLKQRIALRYRLDRLKEREVGSYIDYRLRAVGYENNHLFSRDGLESIAFYSKGIPRLINVICDNALVIAYASSGKKVSAATIKEVAQDIGLESEVQVTRLEAPRPKISPERSFGFLGFDLREAKNRLRKRFILRMPMKLKQMELLRQVGGTLQFSRHRNVSEVLEQIRPIIVSRINYFRVRNSKTFSWRGFEMMRKVRRLVSTDDKEKGPKVSEETQVRPKRRLLAQVGIGSLLVAPFIVGMVYLTNSLPTRDLSLYLSHEIETVLGIAEQRIKFLKDDLNTLLAVFTPTGEAKPEKVQVSLKSETSAELVADPQGAVLPKPDMKPLGLAEQAEPARGYIVQLASFRERDRAESLEKLIIKGGFQAYLEMAHLNNGKTTYRVRVGPYPELTHAREAARQIEGKSGRRVIIIPAPPQPTR